MRDNTHTNLRAGMGHSSLNIYILKGDKEGEKEKGRRGGERETWPKVAAVKSRGFPVSSGSLDVPRWWCVSSPQERGLWQGEGEEEGREDRGGKR